MTESPARGIRFWRDWSPGERTVFAVLAVLVLIAVGAAPWLLGVGPSAVALLAVLVLWAGFNVWIRRRRG